MGFVTELTSTQRIEYLAQIEKHISLNAPITLSSSDIYIVFGEKAFANPILMEAAKDLVSAYSVLGYPSSAEEQEVEQLWAARWWKKTFNKNSHIKSLEPTDWLNLCLKEGGINHILWALKYGRDVVSQYHWAHDIAGLSCEDLHGKLLVPVSGTNPQSSVEGVGYSRDSDPWCDSPTRRQRNNYWSAVGYPSSRRGKQPRGKSLADKRRGNLSKRYIKDSGEVSRTWKPVEVPFLAGTPGIPKTSSWDSYRVQDGNRRCLVLNLLMDEG
jgi:hypothetical protein